MVVVAFSRAYREKERGYYVGGVLCLLGAVWSILFVLDQVPLAGLVWVAAMIIRYCPNISDLILRRRNHAKSRSAGISPPS